MLLWWPGGKESASNAGDWGSVPGLGRFPGEGNGDTLQYSCLENSMDRGAWQARAHGSQRVEHDWVTNTFTFTFFPQITTLKIWHLPPFVLFKIPIYWVSKADMFLSAVSQRNLSTPETLKLKEKNNFSPPKILSRDSTIWLDVIVLSPWVKLCHSALKTHHYTICCNCLMKPVTRDNKNSVENYIQRSS